MSRTALCEHTGLAAVERPLRTVTWKMHILHCLALDLEELLKNVFPIPTSASSPNPTPEEQFNDLAWLALAASTPRGFEMSHPKRPFL